MNNGGDVPFITALDRGAHENRMEIRGSKECCKATVESGRVKAISVA